MVEMRIHNCNVPIPTGKPLITFTVTYKLCAKQQTEVSLSNLSSYWRGCLVYCTAHMCTHSSWRYARLSGFEPIFPKFQVCMCCSLAKEYPWVVHLTCSLNGVGGCSHSTLKEHPLSFMQQQAHVHQIYITEVTSTVILFFLLTVKFRDMTAHHIVFTAIKQVMRFM